MEPDGKCEAGMKGSKLWVEEGYSKRHRTLGREE